MTEPASRQITPGDLLIASPLHQFGDEFNRTVILICLHGPDGTLGLIVNRPTDVTLDHVLEQDLGRDVVHYGGPVGQDCLTYLHRYGDQIQESQHVMDETFFCGDFDQTISVINSLPNQGRKIRFFLGHSGWAPGQLKEELDQDFWFMTRGNSDLIFKCDPSKLWQLVLRKMGGEYAILANFPRDPALN